MDMLAGGAVSAGESERRPRIPGQARRGPGQQGRVPHRGREAREDFCQGNRTGEGADHSVRFPA